MRLSLLMNKRVRITPPRKTDPEMEPLGVLTGTVRKGPRYIDESMIGQNVEIFGRFFVIDHAATYWGVETDDGRRVVAAEHTLEVIPEAA